MNEKLIDKLNWRVQVKDKGVQSDKNAIKFKESSHKKSSPLQFNYFRPYRTTRIFRKSRNKYPEYKNTNSSLLRITNSEKKMAELRKWKYNTTLRPPNINELSKRLKSILESLKL